MEENTHTRGDDSRFKVVEEARAGADGEICAWELRLFWVLKARQSDFLETAEGDPDPAVWTEITERVADRRHGARVGFTGALARVFIKCETVKLASRENHLFL